MPTYFEASIGLDVASLGTTTFQAAVLEQMQALAFTETAAYANSLANRREEFEWLLNRLLVPETWFFRGGDCVSFSDARNYRPIANVLRRSHYRILSLPCTTGEKPYSLAISLLEAGIPASRAGISTVSI